MVFEAALEMATRRGDRASRAVALAGLGRTLGTLGRAERAEPMLLESLQISEALDDKDGMAEAASQLGHLSTQRGRFEESRAYHERSFQLWESIADHKGMIEMAEIERRRGHAAQGLALAAEARDMADAMELPEVRWLAMTSVGRMDVALKRPTAAREAFEAAIAVVEEMRLLNAGGEESRSRFFANRLAPYQERVALALAESNTADAFYFAERSKAHPARGDPRRSNSDYERDDRPRAPARSRAEDGADLRERRAAVRGAGGDEARVTTLQQWRVDSASSTALMLAFHRE